MHSTAFFFLKQLTFDFGKSLVDKKKVASTDFFFGLDFFLIHHISDKEQKVRIFCGIYYMHVKNITVFSLSIFIDFQKKKKKL